MHESIAGRFGSARRQYLRIIASVATADHSTHIVSLSTARTCGPS
jgi:hypothetical protein